MSQNEARAGQVYSFFGTSTHFTPKREHMQNTSLERDVGLFQHLCPSFACLARLYERKLVCYHPACFCKVYQDPSSQFTSIDWKGFWSCSHLHRFSSELFRPLFNSAAASKQEVFCFFLSVFEIKLEKRKATHVHCAVWEKYDSF